VVLAMLVAPVLSGCASGESGPSASSAQASEAGVAELEGGLREEDDEAELKQIIDRETTPEERQELREGLNVEQSEEAQEQPEGAQEQPEGAQEQEAESESELEREHEAEREQEHG
jgi:hypothetical protein